MTYEIKKFKDGQVTAKVGGTGRLDVHIRGNSYEDLFQAASIKEAWDANLENKGHIAVLHIYCLIAQRSDRRFNPNESFDLKVVARFINSMGFDEVQLLHPHSDVSLALIDGAVRRSHFEYVEKTYNALGRPVLVSPDAGAYKATYNIAQQLEADLVPANKVRVNGSPEIHIQDDVAG